jgi:hypothetical protein
MFEHDWDPPLVPVVYLKGFLRSKEKRNADKNLSEFDSVGKSNVAGEKAEPQNIEQEILNIEVSSTLLRFEIS